MLKIIATITLGRDAEVKQIGENTVINFSGAHTTKYNGNEKTIWLECAKWGEKTGVAQYLTKGTKILIEGEPEVRSYPKNDGTTGVSLTVRVSSLELLGSKQEGGNNANLDNVKAATADPYEKVAASAYAPVDLEKLPF